MHVWSVVFVWSDSLKTPWTIAHQAPLSMEVSRQEYWSGLPFPSPGDLPNPGIKSKPPVSPALAGRFFTTEQPGKPHSQWQVLNPSSTTRVADKWKRLQPRNSGYIILPRPQSRSPSWWMGFKLMFCSWHNGQLSTSEAGWRRHPRS